MCTRTLVALTALVIMATPVWPAAAPGVTFYVAPAGSDSAPGTLTAPFATVTRARDAVRALKAAGPLAGPVTVYLRGGTYTLKEPFTLSPADSGTAAAPITYAAYPGEKPVLSGGRVLTGWQPYRGGIVSCSLQAPGLTGLRFRQLFYRGGRQTVARWPNRDRLRPRTGGFLLCEPVTYPGTEKCIRYRPGAFPRQWAKLTEVEVTVFPRENWTNMTVPIASLDPARRVIELTPGKTEIWANNRFWIQNAFEELDSPGEWILDRGTDTVYFYPPDPALAQNPPVVPAVRNLVVFRGDFKQGQFVEYVNLSHLGLECCEQHGVILGQARHCGIIGCTVLQVGGAGIVVDSGTSFSRVAGNDIAFPGGHAIAMYYDTSSPDVCSDNVITNNYAHHCGEIEVCSFGWGSGLSLSGRRNVLSHNLLHDTAYSGINFDGWDNVIEYNHVHHVSLAAQDSGGIYGWTNWRGGSGRNQVRYNRVHDCVGFDIGPGGNAVSPTHCNGLYADDHLSGTTFFGNLVYRTASYGYHANGGWDNTIENNILVDGTMGGIDLRNMMNEPDKCSGCKAMKTAGYPSPSTNDHTMTGIVVRRNIVSSSRPNAPFLAYGDYGGKPFLPNVIKATDLNLAWQGGGPVTVAALTGPASESWTNWQAAGYDQHSLLADPGFVDAAHDDYRLRPDSPAFKLGFEPLPIDQMGLVPSEERASWPVVEPNIPRDGPIAAPFLEPQLPIGRAYWVKTPPQIDGKLDPAEWGAPAAALPVIVEHLDQSGQVIPTPARAQFLCDEGNLYFALAIPAAGQDPLTAQTELVVQPVRSGGPGEALLLSRDAPEVTRPGGDPRSASARTDALQTTEWQIPLAVFGADASPGEINYFRLNLRYRPTPQQPWVGWASPSLTRSEECGYLVLNPRLSLGARNLAVNGECEQGTDQPTGWQRVERIPGKKDMTSTGPQLQWVKEGRGGSHCLRLASDDARAMATNEYWWAQSLPQPPAGTYIMRYNLRMRDLAPQAQNGRFYGEGWANRKEGTNPRYMSLGASPDNHITGGQVPGWTTRESVFQVLPDTELIYMLFGLDKATGSLWIDNVTLEKCD